MSDFYDTSTSTKRKVHRSITIGSNENSMITVGSEKEFPGKKGKADDVPSSIIVCRESIITMVTVIIVTFIAHALCAIS